MKTNIKFKNLFRKTLKEYKINFNSVFKFISLFIGIPLLILYLIGAGMIFSDNLFLKSLLDTSISPGETSPPAYYSTFGIIFNVILILLSLFVYAGIVSLSTTKSKFSLNKLISGAKSSYLKFIFFMILLAVMILLATLLKGLFLFLIIPGVIFLIYCLFGIYDYVNKKSKILSSLKLSYNLVRGFWWKIFGYSIIIFLIFIGVLILKDLILFLPVGILSSFYHTEIAPAWLFTIHLVFNLVLTFLIYLLIVPNIILFFKNLYFELKKVKNLK